MNRLMKSIKKEQTKYMVVSLTVLLMLSGCGNVTGKEEIPEVSVEVDVAESPEEDLPHENLNQEQQDTWEPALSIEMVENKWDWWEADGSIVPMGECSYPKVRINGEVYDVVGRTVEEWFGENGQKCEDIVQELEDRAYAETQDGTPYKRGVNLGAFCTRMDSSVISFQMHYSGTLSETEWESFSFGGNFSVGNGQMLELADILTDEEGFTIKAKEFLLWYLQENYEGRLYENYDEYIEDYCFNGGSPDWCLDAEGIRFMFSPRILATDLVGEIEVTLPYIEVAEYMEEAYCGFHGIGMAVVPVEADIPVSLSEGSPDKDMVRICPGDLEDENGEPVHFEINGEIFEAEDWIDNVMSCYLIRKPSGKTFFLFDTAEFEGSWETYLYELTDKEVHRASESGYGCITAAGVDSVQLMSRVDVLGTYWPKVWYSIEETGEFVQQEFIYSTEPYEFRYLTVTRELPIYIDDSQTILPEGTRLWITATDNDGTAWFRTFPINQEVKDLEGTIRYIRDDGIYIDGISEFEYFEYVPYSG